MSDIPRPGADGYDQWIRANALSAASRVLSSQVTERTHPTVVTAKLEGLVSWAETYLRTGGFPPKNR